MLIERPSQARGQTEHSGRHSWHSFSFSRYYDPAWLGFGVLRVLNEHKLAAGQGFPPHRHANVEIISIVLAGTLVHRDGSGGEQVLRAGDMHWMSAGHGIEYSEFSAAADDGTHFIQAWLMPDCLNAKPAHAQRHFAADDRYGKWQTCVSRAGEQGGLPIRQDVSVQACTLPLDKTITVECDSERAYWLHVLNGEVHPAEVGIKPLCAGDALGIRAEAGSVRLCASADAEIVLFDLPG